MDISAANPVTPSNTEGLPIPRVNNFPTVNPTVQQRGLLIFFTATVGLKTPGFYYWESDVSDWVSISGGGDAFWADAPNTIYQLNSEYKSVSIGAETLAYEGKLSVFNAYRMAGIYNQSDFSYFSSQASGLYNHITTTSGNEVIGVGIFVETANGNQSGMVNIMNSFYGDKTGMRSELFGTGNFKGMYNKITEGASSYGMYNDMLGYYTVSYGAYSHFTPNMGTGYGIYNWFEAVYDGENYGAYSRFSGFTMDNQYGGYNRFETTNDYGLLYGQYNDFDTAHGQASGLYNKLTNLYSTNKYGVYNKIRYGSHVYGTYTDFQEMNGTEGYGTYNNFYKAQKANLERFPDRLIYLNVQHLDQGDYVLHVVYRNKVLVKTRFKKQ